MLRVVLFFFVILMAASAVRVKAAGHDWMTGLDGSLSLSRLSIPGTHDSGARFEPVPGTAICQTLTIAEQLEAGVRFLDIRCRHIDDGFTIHHGAIYQHLDFEGVLKEVRSFLKANPGEAIIMSVKQEHTTVRASRSFEATFDTYTAKEPNRWWLASRVPALDEARGKIVLFRRFGAKVDSKGINASKWPNNATFERRGVMKVQDRYVVPSNIDKWKAIEELLDDAKSGNLELFYVNFASGYRSGMFGIPNIPTVSDDINPRLEGYFKAHPKGRFGVILMDFVTRKRASLIYETNASRS